MKSINWLGIVLLSAGISCIPARSQTPQEPQGPQYPPVADNSATVAQPGAIDLNWVPPAFAQLSAQAAANSSFNLDRDLLVAASSLLPKPDQQTREAIAKLDGISVHLLRFGPDGITDEALVEAVRDAYRQHGWKHLVTSSGGGSPLQSRTVDAWLLLDGANVRGAVVLVETQKSLTLATLKGNLSPVDLLHLRGLFGIPHFAADEFHDAKDK
jgi:hypothetical protein